MNHTLGQKKERILFLRDKIREYNNEYFSLNSPSISDEEFDRLFEELKRLEQNNPDFALNSSPLEEIGSDLITLFPEVPHSIPMLSLNKVYSEEALIKWLEKTANAFSLEQKMDGVSLVLHYERGLLTKALTRGDGKVGSLITDNVKTIKDIPHSFKEKDSLVVRGEVYLLKSDFQRINETQEVKLANPRNLVAGTLRRQDTESVSSIPLKFIAYEGFWDKENSFQPITHRQALFRLNSLGFSLSRDILFIGKENSLSKEEESLGWQIGDKDFVTSELKELKDFILKQSINRSSLDYEVDGLVLKVDDLELREKMGYTSHHPRWAMALKFSFQEAETFLEKILIQVGRTGRITPLALVKPVSLAGVIVSRVTLHNESFIEELSLKVGDLVLISRRGDVIPAVESVVKSQEGLAWKMPEACPFCLSLLKKEGAHHFCSNENCPERVKSQLIFFAGKKQMDITSLSLKTIGLFFDQDFIREEADLYKLDYEKIEKLEGMGKKKVIQLQKALEKSKSQPFRRVMLSLGVRDLGSFVINSLFENGYHSFQDYVDLVEDPNFLEKFTSIKGLGDKLAYSFQDQIRNSSLRRRVENLEKVGFSFREEMVEEAILEKGFFSGQVWCITGTFHHFKKREDIQNLIRENGGKIAISLTKEVGYLLVGEKAGSKKLKAKEMGITLIGEESFISFLNPY